jgi:hypothetical protein
VGCMHRAIVHGRHSTLSKTGSDRRALAYPIDDTDLGKNYVRARVFFQIRNQSDLNVAGTAFCTARAFDLFAVA